MKNVVHTPVVKKEKEAEEINVVKRNKSIFYCKTVSDFELKGPVQRLEQRVFLPEVIEGFIVAGDESDSILHPDKINIEFYESGGKIEEVYFHRNSDAIRKITYYDDGRSKYSTETSSKSGYRYEHFYYYDDEKQFTHSEDFKDGVMSSKTVLQYDDRGNIIEQIRYNGNNEVESRHVDIYNEKNQKIEDRAFDKNGKMTTGSKYSYDERGNKNEYIFLDGEGKVWRTSKHEYMYDEAGNIIGDHGNLYIEKVEYDTRDYEFDSYGNFTLRAAYHNKKPLYIVARSITFYGEEAAEPTIKRNDKNLIKIPYSNKKIRTMKKKPTPAVNEINKEETQEHINENNAEIVRWLSDKADLEKFPANRYYTLINNDIPSATEYDTREYEALAMLDYMKDKMGGKIIHAHRQDEEGSETESNMTTYTLVFPNKPYMLVADNIGWQYSSQYLVPDFISYGHYSDDEYVHIGTFTLLGPSEHSGKRDKDFENNIEFYLEMCQLEDQPDKPSISMIEVSREGYYQIGSYPVEDNFEINDLDLNYGYGFSEFHEQLMERIKTENRGLVLFHGVPGTGKTYYIRHLLRRMVLSQKFVIYMPPNMVDQMSEPRLMTFISHQLSSLAKQGKHCILLVEDAEPLLASRQIEGRVIGISNLLNLTDGILNDMLRIQIICTFNVDLKELDKALLRPGRLIARKEFVPLSVLDANRLTQQLGLNYRFEKPATLAEIYALQKDSSTLIHDQNEDDSD